MTPHEKPVPKALEITLQGNKLVFDFTISRKLNEINGYGYATQVELQNNTALLGPYFPHTVRDYRFYACHRPEVIINPDDADFLPVAEPDAEGSYAPRYSLGWKCINIGKTAKNRSQTTIIDVGYLAN